MTIGKKNLYACFIDFTKAFDSVWHEGLFCKLQNVGITGNLLELLKDVYKKSKCAVKVNHSLTAFFYYTKVVRQGCLISPIIFNIDLNDIFDIINEGNETNLSLNDAQKVNALMYADDLVILSDTKEGLQKHLDKLSEYYDKGELGTNVKTSNY